MLHLSRGFQGLGFRILRVLSPMKPVLQSVVAITVLLQGCAEVRQTNTPTQFSIVDSPVGVSVYYDTDIQTLFDRSCTGGCHEPGGTGVIESGLDLTAGVSYQELLDATRSKNGPHVTGGNPDNSLLVWKVEGVDAADRTVYGEMMPFGRPQLTDSEIAKLRVWIAEGAVWSTAPPSPPRIVSAVALSGTTVEVLFDKALDSAAAVNSGNYTLTAEDGADLPIAGVALVGADVTAVTAVSPFPIGVAIVVAVTGVRDLSGLAITSPESSPFRYSPEVSYAAQIQPVFDQTCAFVTCHAADIRFPSGAGLILDPGTSWGQLVGVSSTQSVSVRVVPGSSASSYLITKLEGLAVSGDRMPVGGPFLTAAETQVFRLWIDQGARDN